MNINANIGAEKADLSAGTVAWQAQVFTKKKSEDLLAQNVSTLLSSLPQSGPQPLATSGTLGTRFNAYA